MEIQFSMTFDRAIEDDDYIVPGGFGVKTEEREINFDFGENDAEFYHEDNPEVVTFCCWDLDTLAFPESKVLVREDIVKSISEITECFVYTAKGEDEDNGPKVVKLNSFSFSDPGWEEEIAIPEKIIETWNKKLA